MTCYAVANLREVAMGADIATYVGAIDQTLATFNGRFVVHGGAKDILEGDWPGDLVVIAFPDRKAAHAWYGSPAYQAILPLRAFNAKCDVMLIDGVAEDHKATDILKAP